MTNVDGLPLRFLDAGNAGPFTLEGTRTWLLGRAHVLVIDPGPDGESHRKALVAAVQDAEQVTLLLTHAHADHAGGAAKLAQVLEAPLFGPGDSGESPLPDGATVPFDDGPLLALSTPGHAQHHVAFHWPAQDALFCGDLLLGGGSTTWVGGYPSCVRDYLASLDRIQALGLRRILPAHGPIIDDPDETIDRYRAHRLERIEQVVDARQAEPDADVAGLVTRVYGQALPAGMRRAAEASIRAIVDYLDGH